MRRHITFTAATAGIMLLLAAPAQLAAQDHAHAGMHGQQATGAASPDAARLGGQAAFATIAEVIRLLEADSTTDWSTVDLERLRAHLADMDAVTLRAQVAREDVPNGARFTVRGDATTLAAARRMATAHAPMLRGERGWEMRVSDAGAPLVVTVTGPDSAAATRIRALGLVGLLGTGEHHALHHVAIARGQLAAHR